MFVDPLYLDAVAGGAIALGLTYVLGKYREKLIPKLLEVCAKIDSYVAEAEEAFPDKKDDGLIADSKEFTACTREIVADGKVTIREGLRILRVGKNLGWDLVELLAEVRN
jgi:hypothetical protein